MEDITKELIDEIKSNSFPEYEDLENNISYKSLIMLSEEFVAIGHLLEGYSIHLYGNLRSIIIHELDNMILNVVYTMTPRMNDISVIIKEDSLKDLIRLEVKPSTGIKLVCEIYPAKIPVLICKAIEGYNLPLKFSYNICSGSNDKSCLYNFGTDINRLDSIDTCWICGSKINRIYDIYEYAKTHPNFKIL